MTCDKKYFGRKNYGGDFFYNNIIYCLPYNIVRSIFNIKHFYIYTKQSIVFVIIYLSLNIGKFLIIYYVFI